MMRKFAIVLISFLFTVLFLPQIIFARKISPLSSPSPTPVVEVREVKYESINPQDGFSYIFKRFNEKIGIFFTFSNGSKVDNYKKLVDIRLSELKFVVDNKQMAFFEKSTQRYFTTAGQLTDFVVLKKMTSEYSAVREMLASHIPVLTQLRDTFNYTTAEWRFVEDDINYAKTYMNKLSQ